MEPGDREAKLKEAQRLCGEGAAIARKLLSLCSEIVLDEQLPIQVATIQNFAGTKEAIGKELNPPFAAGFAAINFHG